MLKSMKNTQEKIDEANTVNPVEHVEQYPYGLRIELSDDVIKKLQLQANPSVGQKMSMTAIVEIIRVEQRDLTDGSKELSACGQITSMEMVPYTEKKEPGAAFYGDQ